MLNFFRVFYPIPYTVNLIPLSYQQPVPPETFHIKVNNMLEALQYEFMQNALIAGLLASVICGVMGTMVVVNRIVFLSGGIAHAAFGGIGLAFFFGWPYLVGTIGFSVIAALVMALVTLKAKHRADTIIGPGRYDYRRDLGHWNGHRDFAVGPDSGI
jgi:uncharacterized membrane protein YjjP (DUF1212 family)